ncbi:thermonuclease family protein [Nitrospirillum pindoramense]|uniref:Endonuclease YncB(Thermonuclease family) n=1 Tax=Nitrospirillum amazonense TaxID=28077 RepID=A0A560HI88_9PROT|nr:thermonuclease family protein [Nitrospirillum amazonense]TWB46172.1 endonuclease YncB(thermonuclease family) [Nitrospirillum amazonense]
MMKPKPPLCVKALPLVLAALAGSTALAAPPPPVGGGGDVIEGHAQATEGDTLLVDGGEIKLYGIDAPDPGQTCQNRRGASYDCFAQATKELQAIVQDKIVRCTTKESPPKQRRLGVCTVEGRDVAGIMVRAGWALAYTALSPDYYSVQVLAMSHRAGMWGGRVEAPWLWRDRQAALEADATGKPKKKPGGQP